MNAHVPQSLATETELVELAAVPLQIISARECKPIISVVQDIALGIYRITKSDVFVSEKQMMNLVAANQSPLKLHLASYEDGKPKQWSGRQLMSTIIPHNINVRTGNKSYDEEKPDQDNFVVIENGVLKQGTLDKTIYQSRTKGLVHSIFNDCGPEDTRLFFDNTQKLVCNWLVLSGFSVGISDLVISEDTKKEIKKMIHDMKVKVYDIIADIHLNKFKNTSIGSNHDFFEDEVNKILNKAREATGKLGLSKLNDKENRMINMVLSGSKGSAINIAQMITCVGQQNVDSKRIPYGFEDRTLPHYTKYDDGPEARGFVENSFLSGLSPQEFFFHAMGGREGLIDTAVKTSETGYLQRKLVKAMEDCKINYDYTVRNASGSIVQFLYGEDGMDGTKLESQALPYIDMDYEKLKKVYRLTERDNFTYLLDDDVIKQLNKKGFEPFEEHFRQVLDDREYMIVEIFNSRQEKSIMYPIAFRRLIESTKALIGQFDNILLDLDPHYVLDTINNLADELYINENNKGNKFLGVLLRAYLSPKRVLFEYKFNKLAFDRVIQEVRLKFYDAIAHPSEMVGVVAAQSIGEPATQMTLNTFHMSGVSSASKAVRGVPRIKELLSVTKNIKAPSMTIYVKEIHKKEKMKCQEILNSIETTFFKDIIKKSEIYFDPTDFNTTIEDDANFLKTYQEFVKLELIDIPNSSPWLLRMEFDNTQMMHHEITMIDIYNVLKSFYEETIDAMFSDDNAKKLVFRIRLRSDSDDMITELKALEKNILETVIVKGVKSINKVVMKKDEYSLYNPDTMSFDKTYEWVLETNGSNLLDVLCNRDIDAYKTICNDVNEIYEVFGIEAARQALYNELAGVIEDADMYVNYRHIALLVDTMTTKGYLLSIDRHGINRVDIGPLAKSSFEETTDMLIKAGIFSEIDKINGVSANIMLGQIPPCGTGDTMILIDPSKLPPPQKRHIVQETKDVEEECAIDNLTIDFVLPEKRSDIQPQKMKIEIV